MKVVLLASLMAFFTIVCGYGLQAEALELLSGWPVEIQEKSNMVPIGPKINYFRADDQAHIVFALPGSGIRCYNLWGELEWMKEYSRAVYDVSIWGGLMAFPETDWEEQTFSIHLLSLLDLEELPGWPRSFPLPEGTCPVVITLCDVDGDNAPGLFFSLHHDTLVYGLDRYGNELAGWPARLEMDISKGYSLAVEDIDNDGEADILVLGTESIQVFTSSGEMKAGFPVRWTGESFTNVAAPVVMDLDGDGCREIIVATFGIDPYHGTVRVYQCDGTNLWNYEIEADYFHSPVAVLSYDEVTYIAVETVRGRLHLLNQEGQLEPGWPVQKIGHGDGLAAVEVDDQPVIVSGCNMNVNCGGEVESYLHLHTLDGSPLAGTPLKLKGFTNFAVPTVFDSLMVVASFRVIFPWQESVNSVYLFKGDFSAHH
ncbi:MAG: FG-GAP repeat domain-containing protein, partial [Candidatus Zixiibacteriota bacterium]